MTVTSMAKTARNSPVPGVFVRAPAWPAPAQVAPKTDERETVLLWTKLQQTVEPKSAAHMPRSASTNFACPRCAAKVARVHRRMLDHVLGALIQLPMRRYACRSDRCGWSGTLTRPLSGLSRERLSASPGQG